MNYSELEKQLQLMTPQSKAYKMIKAELMARGNWKNRSRGKSFAIGIDTRRKKL
ncbi:hypothetical protein UFOVP1522_40 [uncultured Caudovirales phage]|uniref:Uncharacterized protein n=1 Tax=uncultured Caudovirales phage TaxID=2100421 RepID=A0A6J5QJJ2_9CAUD|nr:hypothetical protein UFOVP989_47 [uncultured Caudovirales phage]CAB4181168.1 hypothetical protein UFOVP1075_19 [uncultured Caudovirales phage]CAB4198720.1 hypothetical protein UFOVP1312_11 [uncultured Caudovirales phage]CAB4210848.1 hypothetical protein UFOVP1426_47 [uncultured Caudovirales phage]CAB5227449.1 hypothetical protein UFOVP1522_40 [uncultured Caudovirales phage]